MRIRLVEGVYIDEGFTRGIKKISDLLWKSKDTRQVEKYGIWLLQRDRVLGLKVSPSPSPLVDLSLMKECSSSPIRDRRSTLI
jgi:hypothetical protein